MRQLMETGITISHYAHTLIAKNLQKSHSILDRFSSFLQTLATQHTIYENLYVLTVMYI